MRSTSLAAFCVLAVLSAYTRATPIPWDKPAVSASTGFDSPLCSFVPQRILTYVPFSDRAGTRPVAQCMVRLQYLH
ncbi:hypothetical protein FB451DRAFT_552356 [Mycena latifolia]|nr:hypothetical protein FB451DRAFT_552356 [Mycena latifolia]